MAAVTERRPVVSGFILTSDGLDSEIGIRVGSSLILVVAWLSLELLRSILSLASEHWTWWQEPCFPRLNE